MRLCYALPIGAKPRLAPVGGCRLSAGGTSPPPFVLHSARAPAPLGVVRARFPPAGRAVGGFAPTFFFGYRIALRAAPHAVSLWCGSPEFARMCRAPIARGSGHFLSAPAMCYAHRHAVPSRANRQRCPQAHEDITLSLDCERGLSAPLALPPSVFHGFIGYRPHPSRPVSPCGLMPPCAHRCPSRPRCRSDAHLVACWPPPIKKSPVGLILRVSVPANVVIQDRPYYPGNRYYEPCSFHSASLLAFRNFATASLSTSHWIK